jgi:mono/diheme cytochrome c family protein
MQFWFAIRSVLRRVLTALTGLAGLWPLLALGQRTDLDAKIDFTRQIRPILSENCFACHGNDDKKRKAGLRLDLKSEAFQQLKSGDYALVPGQPAKSELVRRITSTDPDEKMPPSKSGKKLSREEIELLCRWVQAGADYRNHWAYLRPECPALPPVQLKQWPRNPIDYFVLARLEGEGLKPSPEASRRTLIRRLSLDLTGLPPTVEDVEDFVRDNRPEAYDELVDRLLASPQYGERWARPWLDEARYADSNGYEADYRRSIWPYRDWVINALNRDLPFDEFTIEQLAGDLLPNATRDQKIATGFHRNSMVNTEGGTDDEEFRVAAVVDRVNTTFAVWMGTTIGCAQCHNHKYDPFTQKEYYQLFAFFNQTLDKGRSNEPELELPTPQQQARRRELQKKLEPLEKTLRTQTPELDRAEQDWEEDLLRDHQMIEESWSVLNPEDLDAQGGVQLSLLPDKSVLANGALPDTSEYGVAAEVEQTGITAVRLEALADPRLPNKSCGRSEDGDFVLTEFTAEAFAERQSTTRSMAPPQIGHWYALGPFPAETLQDSFSRSFIDERNVDLKQTYGKLRWTERPDFADGAVHALEGGTAATYLYRTIRVEEARPLTIALGSDDGLQVWLNGKKVLSHEVERAAAPNQDSVELQLVKGENHLLMKVNNGSGDYAFFFAVNQDPGEANRVPFAAAYADYAMEKYGVTEAIDGKPKTGWSIGAFEPANRVDHRAVFITKHPAGFEGGTRLVFHLKQESDRAQHLLGRFRLAVSTAPTEALREWGRVPASIRPLLLIPDEERDDHQRDQLAEYYRSIDPALDRVRERVAEIRKGEPKDIPTTLVMEGLSTNRPTHILIRGSFLNPGDAVEPGTPAILHPWPAGEPKNRLGLAHWLTDPANPLIGRVTINRIWAQYFGRGLVETSQDFGSQGDLPTHPELLDWLATEFIRQRWSLKAMHRLIVTSATYRQSSDATPLLLEKDPFNRLLARGPRFRMEAEMLRDNALAVSGLLDEKIGGPSVFPHQPEGVWNSPYNGDRWVLSEGGDRYRRGLYTFWRRTAPYASFAAFDAPSREVMCERRARSNTPVQALITLNDPAFLAAAEGLARRVLAHGGSTPEQRLTYGFETCVARPPEPEEMRPLLRLYEETLAQFRRDAAAVKAMIGNRPDPAAPAGEAAEYAAWAVISNVLLNLDETLTKG